MFRSFNSSLRSHTRRSYTTPSTPIRSDQRRIIISTASFTLSGLGLYAFFRYEKANAARLADAARNAKSEQGVGKALVGGPFSLVDLDGCPRTDLDYRGKYLLVYFGYVWAVGFDVNF
jgi:cytochrome oxidase Cu insertion factor (SCO1/SenC/PrrC family)